MKIMDWQEQAITDKSVALWRKNGKSQAALNAGAITCRQPLRAPVDAAESESTDGVPSAGKEAASISARRRNEDTGQTGNECQGW